MQMNCEIEQFSMFDLDLWCGKMSPEPSPAERPKEKISVSSWRKSFELKAIPLLSLDLTPGHGNLLGESYWELISPWRGESSTLNTGPAPRKGGAVSTLSAILQDDPHPKYYLTRKACRGILRRASEREKELPPKLKRALEIQAGLIPPDGKPTELKAFHINQREEDIGHQPLVYENHGIDSRYTGPHKVAPTMSARYGTGGNNVPLVEQEPVYCITGNAIDRQPQNGGNGIGYQEDIAYTLTATDHHAVFSRQRVDVFKDGDVVSTQSARQHKDATDLVMDVAGLDCRNARENGDLCGTLQKGTSGSSLNSIHPIRGGQLIRRLTPLECERLQGFPDGWTDIPNASDSARYKALGNSVAIPCVDYVLEGIALALRAG